MTQEITMTREEAIKLVKERVWLESGRPVSDALEMLIPELRESEDERIRELLVWQVHQNIEDETNDLAKSVYDGIKGHDPDLEESIEDWKKCLAWLEKQKGLFTGRGLYYYDGEKTTYLGYPATEENPYDFAISQQEKQKECVADSSKTSADEDERIREWLIEMVEEFRKANPTNAEHNGNCSEAIAYLDKQKDLDKMIVVSPEVWDNAITEAFENGKKDGEKQKEQKQMSPRREPSNFSIITKDERDFIADEFKAFLCNYEKEFDDDAPLSDVAEHFFLCGKNYTKEMRTMEETELNSLAFLEQLGYTCIPPRVPTTIALKERKPLRVGETAYFEPHTETRFTKKEQTSVDFTHHEIDESLRDAVTHQMEDDGDVDDFIRRSIDDIALKYAELGAKWQKEQNN